MKIAALEIDENLMCGVIDSHLMMSVDAIYVEQIYLLISVNCCIVKLNFGFTHPNVHQLFLLLQKKFPHDWS